MNDEVAQPGGVGHRQGQTAPVSRKRAAGVSNAPGKTHSHTLILLVASGIALLAAVLVGTTVTIINLRESSLLGGERELANTASLLARHFDQQFGQLDRLQTGIIEYMRTLDIASHDNLERTMSGQDVQVQLAQRIAALSDIDRILVVDAAGIVVNGSVRGQDSGGSMADRDFFKALKSDPHLNLFVSEPFRGQIDGEWKLIVARKFSASNGDFLGLIAGPVDLRAFEDYFRSIALGEGSVLALQRDDGLMLVHHPRIEGAIGRDYKDVLSALGHRQHGVLRLAGKIDGKRLILATHRLSAYPLLVTVGMDQDFVLNAWRKEVKVLIGLGGGTAGMIVLMVFVIARRLSRGEKQIEKKFEEQATQLSVAFSHMSEGLVIFNSTAQLVVCNDRYREVYGLSADVVKPGCGIEDLLKHRAATGTFYRSPEEYVRDLLAAIGRGEVTRQQTRLDDGRLISVVNRPMANGGWVATHEDITEKRRSELQLDETKRFLDLIIENIPIGVVVKDARTRKFVLVNRAYESMLGRPRADLLGLCVFDIYKEEQAARIDKNDRETLQDGAGVNSADYDLDIPLRGLRTLATSRLLVRDDEGNPKYFVAVIDDVTERKKAERRISFMAHHDALTGLPNRSAITQKIEEAAARQRRRGEPFSILMLDLDRFKEVNDTLGHPTGDALLTEVATRLRASLRETDSLGRLGGDEFAVIQAGEDNQREAAAALADRIQSIISTPFNVEGNEINIGTSIGISLAPEHSTNPDSLLKMADLALYRGKSAGGNGYCFFDPVMSEAAGARHELETKLRHAIQEDELVLHYQPIIDTRSGKICCAEALIRWRHPSKGMVPPDQFIPLAEETGLITRIGEWVLHTACSDAARWPEGVKVAVNLSPVQFRKSNLPDVVMYALAQSGLPPERLELEITETALIESAAECLPALRQFRNLGIAVALDDFGTGYSSLGQLTMFPFDKIKIDKSFTQNMTKRTECAAIILAARTLAHSLNMAITAEGVETTEQSRLLRLNGVTSQQGYLFRRPVPVSEIDFDGVYGDLVIEDAA